MDSSSSSSRVLRSPPCSPRFSRPIPSQLSPVPGRLRCRSSDHRITATATASSAACTSPEKTLSPLSPTTNSLYEVLGIPIGASNDEIKAAYRRLARICHPDVVSHDAGAGDDFIRIHSAYSTLSDPDKRADYDLKLRRRSRIRSPVSFNPSSFSTFPRRNWETDQCW